MLIDNRNSNAVIFIDRNHTDEYKLSGRKVYKIRSVLSLYRCFSEFSNFIADSFLILSSRILGVLKSNYSSNIGDHLLDFQNTARCLFSLRDIAIQ